jgi:hypothetical protein
MMHLQLAGHPIPDIDTRSSTHEPRSSIDDLHLPGAAPPVRTPRPAAHDRRPAISGVCSTKIVTYIIAPNKEQ